jgi:hypothetical protein
MNRIEGTINGVEIRAAWPSEADEFGDWIAEIEYEIDLISGEPFPSVSIVSVSAEILDEEECASVPEYLIRMIAETTAEIAAHREAGQ